ncbi:complement C1q-like protein 4 [Gigantopelta aegis]|uniref:complement C1q-like protein 4 n=1 Tax=Gigantopelta aegis TaxID=1735272 RepID=UPI001B88A825|nr:complement C1q-like protein 4 [Gigantopelta aegis]
MNAFVFLTVLLSSTYCTYGQGVRQEVAFSVGLTHHLNLTGSQTVVYDEIITNIGAAYDLDSGFFKCPMSGIYVFQFHALSRSDRTVYLQLHHNYNYVVSIWSHTNGEFAAGGNSAILHLTKGDTVSIKSVSGYSNSLFGKPDEVYCTFSGYMISVVFEEMPIIGK